MSAYEGIELIGPKDLSNPGTLADKIRTRLQEPRQARETGISFEGLENAADAVLETLRKGRG